MWTSMRQWLRNRYQLVGYRDPAATVPVRRRRTQHTLYWTRRWTEVTDE